MDTRHRFSIAVRSAFLIATVLVIPGVHVATATVMDAAETTVARLSHIHNGTCQTLDSVAWSLNDAVAPGAPVTAMGTPIANPSTVAEATGVPVPLVTDVGPVIAQGVTRVQVHLTDLEKAPFAIDVHTGLGSTDPLELCGDVTGAITDNSVTVPLLPVGNSDLRGVALLHDDGTGMTTITVQVLSVSGGPEKPPQTVATIELVDIAFTPKELTIAAGTDVVITLMNTGVASHNFSITDHHNPDVQNLEIAVDLQPGQSTTVTINAPAGDYYFFCNVPGHEAAGMFGTLHLR